MNYPELSLSWLSKASRMAAPVNTCQRGDFPDIPDSVQAFKLRRLPVKILKSVPRASRGLSARLAEILDCFSSDGSESSWDRLFCFPARCLRVPDRGSHCRSLASHTNQRKRTPPSSSLSLIVEIDSRHLSREIFC